MEILIEIMHTLLAMAAVWQTSCKTLFAAQFQASLETLMLAFEAKSVSYKQTPIR